MTILGAFAFGAIVSGLATWLFARADVNAAEQDAEMWRQEAMIAQREAEALERMHAAERQQWQAPRPRITHVAEMDDADRMQKH